MVSGKKSWCGRGKSWLTMSFSVSPAPVWRSQTRAMLSASFPKRFLSISAPIRP